MDHLVNRRIRPLKAYTVAPARPDTVLDANESPWSLSDDTRAKLGARLAALAFERYPDPRATRVRELVAELQGCAPDQLVLGAGSDEAIVMLMAALSEPRGADEGAATDGARPKVMYPTPTFVMYGITATVQGWETVEVPTAPGPNGPFSLDEGAMLRALDAHRPNLVFLATPNNPTGNAFDPAVIERLLRHDRDALFVVDEAYGAFADKRYGGWMAEHPNLAVMGTLSKIGLAALRLGWVALPGTLATEVDKARQPYNLNSLSQVAAEVVLSEFKDELSLHIERIKSERERLHRALGQFSALTPHPTEANLILTHVHPEKSPLGAAALTDALRQEGIAIKCLHGYGGPLTDHVRISIGRPEQNDHLVDTLTKLLRA